MNVSLLRRDPSNSILSDKIIQGVETRLHRYDNV